MRPPYFEVTAQCKRCQPGEFFVQRKQVVKKNTEGRNYTISQVVCPGCRMWAEITKIERVAG